MKKSRTFVSIMNQKSFSCIWIRREDNLALFLQDLTDMHLKKSNLFQGDLFNFEKENNDLFKTWSLSPPPLLLFNLCSESCCNCLSLPNSSLL